MQNLSTLNSSNRKHQPSCIELIFMSSYSVYINLFWDGQSISLILCMSHPGQVLGGIEATPPHLIPLTPRSPRWRRCICHTRENHECVCVCACRSCQQSGNGKGSNLLFKLCLPLEKSSSHSLFLSFIWHSTIHMAPLLPL